ncbi:sensor histidine kinase [Flavobacterium sp. RHBU_3]|uniref:sensor histidine kinase n=1 Tax=Flavobacterium sp. RHBU_3 TaxID=3391184 RepID=UPI003985418E
MGLNKKNRSIVLQGLAFLAFAMQPIILPSQMPGGNGIFHSPMTLVNIFSNILLFCFFYFNYYYLIPKLYYSKKYFVYAAAIATSLIIIIAAPHFILKQLLPKNVDFRPPPPPPGPGAMHFHDKPGYANSFYRFQEFFSDYDQVFFMFVVIVSVSLFLWVRSRWFHTEKARHEAEIAYLISQMNPHFLFNALNSIYTLTVTEKADRSSESMLKLSDIMRYMVVESGNESVPLEKEVAYISDYIELQKLRLDPGVNLEFNVTGSLSGKRIAPLLLIPFIENAFKYGVNPDEDSEILIDIVTDADAVQLQVKNRKMSVINNGLINSGIGISNTRNRLNLMYPQKHLLLIEDTPEFFSITLTIYFR